MPQIISINSSSIREEDLNKVAIALTKGKIVALPTETVYGLAANLDNKETLKKLSKIKKRPTGKKFTVHIGSLEELDLYVEKVPPYGYRLIEKFWPGPLTLVCKEIKSDSTLGVRYPDHSVTARILRQARCRIVMPSANLSGGNPAVTPQEVDEIFGDKVDIIVDSLLPELKVSSTVVDVTKIPFKILRSGAIYDTDIKNLSEKRRVCFVCTGNTCRSPMAEYILKEMLKKRRPDIVERVEVVSCGTAGIKGAPASQGAQTVLSERGIDVTGHRSRGIDKYLVKSCDVILNMSKGHQGIVLELDPNSDTRTFLLGDFSDNEFKDVPDPLGGEIEDFRKAADLISKALDKFVDWL